MNTRCKFHYKSGLYFLNFSSNVILKTVFTDGFESMSSWKKYVYSDTWIPINNSQETYYTVSGWVYVEDVMRDVLHFESARTRIFHKGSYTLYNKRGSIKPIQIKSTPIAPLIPFKN